MDGYRIEKDSLGDVRVPSEKIWGAQTQRSLEHFKIGTEKMPKEIITAFALMKKACAIANCSIGVLPENIKSVICIACDEIVDGKWDGEFPLVVWQTGSGTQSNMNLNEVIAHRASELLGSKVHPNNHVNMSQSSNDTFPTAMHLAAVSAIEDNLLPAINVLRESIALKSLEFRDIVKTGRTHLQDATPLTLGQEFSGYVWMLERCEKLIKYASDNLKYIALGGTAVGTGLNCPLGFDVAVAEELSNLYAKKLTTSPNKFHALTSKDEIVFAHGALKALAADMMKIANDIRWLGSGPRCGIGELIIPANEPGSSIMPGKVNPTQCEAVTMVAVQVMANDVAVGIGASQGNFELNVFMPVIIYNFLQSVRLLTDSIVSFNDNCVVGIKPNFDAINKFSNKSLMVVTALNPLIGYDNCAKIALKAHRENLTLKEAVLELGFLTSDEFDELVDLKQMCNLKEEL